MATQTKETDMKNLRDFFASKPGGRYNKDLKEAIKKAFLEVPETGTDSDRLKASQGVGYRGKSYGSLETTLKAWMKKGDLE